MSGRACELKVERLSAVEKVWRELFEKAANPSPFTSYEWFSALARHVLKLDPDVVVFHNGSIVFGILAASITRDGVRSIGDERVTDLYDVLFMPGYENVVTETLADFVIQRGLGFDLFPLEVNSVLTAGLQERLSEISVEKKDLCPLLELSVTWDDYLHCLDGKSRHELRRKMRRINGAAISDVKSADIDILFRLMSISDSSKDEFLTPGIVAFFRELTDLFDRNGWLRLRALIFERNLVGIILAFAFKRCVYLYNMGFDPQYRHLSPGIMTVAFDIQSAISQGYEYYDFLRGDEEYKYRLGAKERYTMRVAR
jgi:CelD/BcsL family acetyltransferase involved in cellulose biosynthesis